ncbi:MAG: DUF4142 domain-containing protein [Bdellovibrionales bacterium]
MTKRQERMTLNALRIFGGLLIIAGCVIAASTASRAVGTLNAEDFVNKASVGNQFELESSRMALQKTKNDEIKEFAQQMVNDHTETATKLKTTLSLPDAEVPMPNNKLDAKHENILKTLRETSPGQAFDKKYIQAQKEAHNEAIALFKTYAENGDNSPLKSFATETLPTLEEHRKMIPEIK